MVETIDQRRKSLENELINLQRQVESMDAKLRAYLADRENKPHPRHMELVDKVQNFRVEPGLMNRNLETMLDNLQWKVYYYNRAWRQLWENAEMLRRSQAPKSRKQPGGEDDSGGREENGRSIYSVDRLWKIQKERLEKLGKNPEPETKDDFVKRIKQQYGQLASSKSDDEEIIMKFDKKSKRCTLDVKKRKGT